MVDLLTDVIGLSNGSVGDPGSKMFFNLLRNYQSRGRFTPSLIHDVTSGAGVGFADGTDAFGGASNSNRRISLLDSDFECYVFEDIFCVFMEALDEAFSRAKTGYLGFQEVLTPSSFRCVSSFVCRFWGLFAPLRSRV